MSPSWHPLQEASTSVLLEGREKRVHPSTVKGVIFRTCIDLFVSPIKKSKRKEIGNSLAG